MAALSTLDFLNKYEGVFADNEFQNIDEESFRDFSTDQVDSFVNRKELNVKMVKGATFPVAFTDNLDLIPAAYLILGMEAMARVGTDSSTAAAIGGTLPGPVYFQLIRDSAGTVAALLDENPDTVLTTPAKWVQVSGTDDEKINSFDEFVPEDRTPSYKAGDVFKYTFTTVTPNVTRLLEVKFDLPYFTNPTPTGDDSDPYYKNYAPLSVLGGGSNTFAGLTDSPTANAALAVLLSDKADQAAFTAAVATLTTALAAETTARTAADAGKVALAGDTMSGPLILSDPTTGPDNDNRAVSRGEARGYVFGIAAKDEVRLLLTAIPGGGTLATAGLPVVQGVQLVEGDRVILSLNTALSGIYLASAGTWVRAADANTTGRMKRATAFVMAGDYAADTNGNQLSYTATLADTGVLGTTAFVFRLNYNMTYGAGTGLALAANGTFSVSFGTTAGTVTQGNDARLSDTRDTTWTSVRALVSGAIAAVVGAFSGTDTLETWLGKLRTMVETNTNNISNNTNAITAAVTTLALDTDQTGSFACAATAAGKVTPVNSTVAATVTLPTTGLSAGMIFWFTQMNTGQLTVAAGTGHTILNAKVKSAERYADLAAHYRGGTSWIIYNGIA